MRITVHGPFGYRLFRKLLEASQAAREDHQGLAARSVRQGVVGAVRLLQRWRGVEFPARATGGWWWVWRWRFEFLMDWFEWESLVWVRRMVRPGMTVVDLGAHIGYYSRILSALVGPQGKVLAFEPNPENLAVLRRNLSGPRYRNVDILPYAVSDRNTTGKLFVSSGHSNHSLIKGFSAAEKEIDVETVSLDAFLGRKGIRTLDFVKLDVEGAESMALLGMAETIRRSSAMALLVEYNPLALRASGTSPGAFVHLLEGLELQTAAILEDASLGPVPDLSQVDLYCNLLCSRAGALPLATSAAYHPQYTHE